MVHKLRIICIIFLISTLLMITGCASLGKSFEVVEAVPPDKALIYFYRPGAFVGGGAYYDIIVNDKLVCTMYNGGYYPYFVDPGKINITASTEVTRELTFVAKTNQIYYVKGGITMGILVGRPSLEMVSSDVAREEIILTDRIPDITAEDLKLRKQKDEEF